MPAGREGTRHQDQPRDGERQRPAAAHHGRHPVGLRPRPDHGVQQLPPTSTTTASSISPTSPRSIGKREGGLYKYCRSICSDGKIFMSMPWAVIGAMIAYRKSWFERGRRRPASPKTWEEYREVGKKLKAKGHPIGQTLGHTFGDAPTFTYPYLWSWGGKEVEQDGKTVVDQLQGDGRVGEVHARPSGRRRCDEGALAWDDTNNNRAFLSGTISATLNGASIYIETPAQARHLPDREGQADEGRHPARAAAGGTGRTVRHASDAVGHADEVLEEPGRREGVPEVDPHREELREVVPLAEGLLARRCTAKWEQHKLWNEDPVMAPFKVAARLGQAPGFAGLPNQKAAEALSEVHHHRHVRQGGAGHARRGVGEVGGGRAARRSTPPSRRWIA